MSRPRTAIFSRIALAAVAGLMAGPQVQMPVTLGISAATQAPAPREQSPIPAPTRAARRKRRATMRATSYRKSLRRVIEERTGALTARQWVRIRRYLSRAARLHGLTAGMDYPPAAGIVRLRVQPMIRQADFGAVLLALHKDGVVFIGQRSRVPVLGLRWKWIEDLA